MPLRLYSLSVGLVNLFLLLGCQSATTEPMASGYDYFPLETGRYVVYDVQEQQYLINTSPIQRTYQLKEVAGKAYTDVTGQTAFRLMRYRRSAVNQPWQADSSWSARLVNNEAIRAENGLDFVKLLFPVQNLLTWDGNQRNAADSDDYKMCNVGQVYYVQGRQFDQTVTVVEQDDSTLIGQDKRIDVYARQIGLIYKERTQLQFCKATPACTGRSQIEYGIRQVYRINTYGKE
ncbi:hypothetical protein [Spirosoma validum]|uniref:Lipoprotein n=1 Tax=Spirosoma validum TaxID=2771355 RepID=A0A927B2M9_9BACT|nr:hypothetical protein [Spirosoma validum]MBD2754216.1 hypothetical protein [Spirosoma validum]